MKMIYTLIIIPLIFASFFIGFIANDVILQEGDLDSIIDTLTGKPTSPSLPEQTQEPLISQAAYQTSTPETLMGTWQEGETVKVNFSFPIQYVKVGDYDLQVGSEQFDWYLKSKDLSESYVDDGSNEWENYFYGGTNADPSYSFLYVRLYVGNTPATLSYGFRCYSRDGADAGGVYAPGPGSHHEGTHTVETDELDRQGYISLAFYCNTRDDTNTMYTGLFIRDESETGNIEYIVTDTDTWTYTSCSYSWIFISHLYVQSETNTGFYRSEYQVVSPDTIEHRLTVENPDWNTEITVYMPLHWNYSSISPKATTEISSNNLIISDTIATTYNIFFSSGVGCGQDYLRQKQYLAISQFYSEDFEGDGGDNLNSTIVSKGAFSERKTSGNLNFEDDDLPEGYYYADIDCYIETAPTAIVLQYYDGSSWINATSASVSITDRWEQLFAYLHPAGVSSGYTIRIVIDGNGVVFYDDINFNTVNHEVETTDWGKITVSGQEISWDTNQGTILEKVNITLWDNASKTLIVSNNVTTNANGNWEWTIDTSNYSYLQEERVIGVNSTVYSSISPISNTSTKYYSPATLNSSSCILYVTNDYAYLSSGNNSFGYRIEVDNLLQEYSIDLLPFSINMSFGTHEINATPFLDLDRSGVFLPGPSITATYKVSEFVYRRVWFDFVDGVGIGLDWETFKLFINGSRQYSQELTVLNGTLLCLQVFDFFNVSLTEVNYTITADRDIAIVVDVYEVIFRNNNTEFKSIIDITRGGQNLVLHVEPGGSINHRFTEGSYSLNISYVVEQEISYEIKNPENYTVGVHTYKKSNLKIGTKLKFLGKTLDSNVVDVGGPVPEPTIKGMIQLQLAFAFILGVIIATFLTALFGYFWRTRVIEPIDRRVDFSVMKEGVQQPIVDTSSDALGFFPLTERRQQESIKNPRKAPTERRHSQASKKKDSRRK